MGGHITEPLLYIDQPTIEKPKAFMQDYYYNSPSNKQQEEKNESEDHNDEKGELASEELTGPFKDLAVNEKIAYLLNLPEEVPKIRCEFVTEERNYRGVLLEEKEEEIIVRVLGKEYAKIRKEQLTNIHMLGF